MEEVVGRFPLRAQRINIDRRMSEDRFGASLGIPCSLQAIVVV
jgi:hypothetical protein